MGEVAYIGLSGMHVEQGLSSVDMANAVTA